MRSPFHRRSFKAWPVAVHVIAWILYGTFIHLTNYITNPHIKLINTALYLIPLSVTFYFSLYCLNLVRDRGVGWKVAVFFIVFIILGLLVYTYLYLLLPLFGAVLYSSRDFDQFLKYAALGYVQHFFYALLYFYIIQAFRKERALRNMQEQQLRNELENARLQEQQLRAQQEKLLFEHAYLRAQVNPHFLRNALNLLFDQALEHSQALADKISKLARMMQYSLDSVKNEDDKVPLKKELHNLQLLFDINQLRFDDKTVFLNIEGEPDGLMVPPLSLITVAENAFKYGDLKDPGHPMEIRLKLRRGEIYFYCRNKKRKTEPTQHSGNTGISNLRRRLDVSFKDRYKMNVNNDEKFYAIELIIKN